MIYNTVYFTHFGYKSFNTLMNHSSATSDILCSHVTGPPVGTLVCAYCVAIHRPAFTTSWLYG